MDLRELSQLTFYDECSHWWIKTRFLYLGESLKFFQHKIINIREYGCGSGQNMLYLSNFHNTNSIEGVDSCLPENFTAPYNFAQLNQECSPMIFDLLAAPLTGLTWIADQIHERVMDDFDPKTVLSKQLLQLQMAFDLGAMDEDTFDAKEEEILLALQAIEDEGEDDE